MNELILCIPLLLALLALIMGVARSITGAWLNYRVKLELLKKLERNPELVNSPAEVQNLYERLAPDPRMGPQDYTVTGIVLAVIGGACIGVGLWLRFGQIAAGTYWGGIICVIIGALLALLGLFVRFLRRGLEPRQPLES
jgi:hypothetical protein